MGSVEVRPVGGRWLGLTDWVRVFKRGLIVTSWALASCVAAVLSYVFGMAAIFFGILYRVQTENSLWPAAYCLVIGLMSARGSLACLDQAFPLRKPY